MQECALSVSNLACQRGDRLLFRGLSFTLSPGEALHVLGANGLGKSSLLRIAAGLLRPVHGTVERHGGIGMIDERPALDSQLPLAQALAFWQRLDLGTEEACERLGLTGLLDVPVGYLSTGQKKRAAMARLIHQKAALWLLDEPLNGLDQSANSLVQDIVSEHISHGGIALIASHQAFEVPALKRLELANYLP